MKKLNLKNVTQFVEKNIGEFHKSRLETVKSIKLKEVLKSKNPYLFKAKNVSSASEIVEGILNAYLSSSEEGIFGNWLERLAIFINDSVYNGRKAGIPGIDLDFDNDGHRYLISIKSGPKWGNADQPDLYIKIIEPLGHEAAEKNNEFQISYGNLVNRLTKEFLDDFCRVDGSIDWEKLLIFNSSFEPKA